MSGAAQVVLSACHRLVAEGLIQGTSGNVSQREGDGFVITPSGVPYDVITPQSMVHVGLDGMPQGGKPSSEWRMHRDIYAARAEAGAVVHTHSPYATALSCLRADIPPFHYMIAIAGGSSLRCSDYALFGTQALSDAMLRALEGRSACLLGNHGMICFGRDLADAMHRAAEVESLCQHYILACQMGAPTLLSEAEMAQVLARFKTYGPDPTKG